ncbi:MAG: hypothetical protein ACKVWR_19965 [Acidimicrobiales bacterium]
MSGREGGGAPARGASSVSGFEVRGGGAPAPEEVAAILAAHEALWPRPAPGGPPPGATPSRWRFSGRWWTKPSPVRQPGSSPW